MICARCAKPFVRDLPHVSVLQGSPLAQETAYVHYHARCWEATMREAYVMPAPTGEYGPVLMSHR